MNGQRVLTALVFTDAVAFSTRVQQDEEKALREMQADFETMRLVAESHSGRILKTMGDGLLMVFDSAAEAVDAALEIQRQFAERPEGSLQHRMGVHLSDVVMEEHDAHGDGVNLAARLEAEASPGGICLSQTIYDIVKSRLPVQAKFLGERHLKNLVEPVNVFEIAPSNAPRGQRIPPKGSRTKGNYATAGAMVFLGCSILAFAAVQATRVPNSTVYVTNPGRKEAPAKPSPASKPAPQPASRQESAPTVARQTPPPSNPVAPKPKVEPEPKPTTVAKTEPTPKILQGETKRDAQYFFNLKDGEFLNPNPQQIVRLSLQREPEYQLAAQRFAKNYDFKGMRAWLEEQEEYKQRPEYQHVVAKWDRLDALMTRLETDLGARDADEALRVAFPLSRGTSQTTVWSSSDGKIEVQARNGKSREFEVRKLDPVAIRALVMASARDKGDLKELRPLLATFDQQFFTQYGETFRKGIRPGTSRRVGPPNVPEAPSNEIKTGSDKTESNKTESATAGL